MVGGTSTSEFSDILKVEEFRHKARYRARRKGKRGN